MIVQTMSHTDVGSFEGWEAEQSPMQHRFVFFFCELQGKATT